MTEKELAQIETKLKITLPTAYRELILARGDELRKTGYFNDTFSSFYVDPEEIISANKLERPKDSGTAYAFPKWWQTFFLIGTNGGGDYYCLRLDNKPGVWMIGSDCGDKPSRVSVSLKAYVDGRVKEFQAEEKKAAARQTVLREETKAEPADADSQKWLAAQSPYALFEFLDNLGIKLSPRKLRLYGLACCRLIEDLTKDKECQQAVKLAEQLVQGVADKDKVARLRERLKTKYLAIVSSKESSPAGAWGVGAAQNLLQDDSDYLRDAPIFAGDAELLRVWYATNSATGASEMQTLADLLREVVGNPFHPVDFDADWRTKPAVELARTIYEKETFEKLPELAAALRAAGCDEPRILKHCERKKGHVRGCWVLDLVLGLADPPPGQQPFSWDFRWSHPKIDAARLKRRLQQFGTDAAGNIDEAAALAFADWLAKNGDANWAEYIRIRCALDGKAPGLDFPTLCEQYLECSDVMRGTETDFEGLYFSGYQFADRDSEHDDMERGLPSMIDAVPPSEGAAPVATFTQRLDALVRQTPFRGIDFQEHYPDEMDAILNSPGARQLHRLAFDNRHHGGMSGAAIAALAKAPCLQTLERLDIGQGLPADADVLALAAIDFKCLRHLELHAATPVDCSARSVARLTNAAWFRRLHHLHIGFGNECCETGMSALTGMPHLHTLICWGAHCAPSLWRRWKVTSTRKSPLIWAASRAPSNASCV